MTEVQRLAKIMVLKDLLKEYELLAKYNGGTDYDRYCALEMAIKELEQEPKKFYDKGYADGQRALTEHIELCKEEQESRTEWIPVSERLPEDYQNILFSTKTDRVFEGRYFDDNTGRQWYAFRDDCFAWNNVITAWMPLPKPYKMGSEVNE